MKKNHKKKKRAPRIKVKKEFPYSLTRVLKSVGVASELVEKFLEQCPPDYKKGRVRRYREIPESAQRCKIIKQGGFQVVSTYSRVFDAALFEGALEECQKVLKATVIRWWSLPRGKEFETVAQEILGLKKQRK